MIPSIVLGRLDLLTVILERIARDFNRSGERIFGKVCHAGLLHRLKSYGISAQIFFCSVINSFEWF